MNGDELWKCAFMNALETNGVSLINYTDSCSWESGRRTGLERSVALDFSKHDRLYKEEIKELKQKISELETKCEEYKKCNEILLSLKETLDELIKVKCKGEK